MNLMDILSDQDTVDIEELISPTELIEKYRESKPHTVAFDTESPSYKWHLPENGPFAASFSWGPENTYYLPLCDAEKHLSREAVEAVYAIVTSAPILVTHNCKYELHVAMRMFREFQLPLVVRTVHDTMIMSHMLHEQRSHALKILCTDMGISYTEDDADALQTKIGEWMEEEKKATGREPGFDEVPARLMVPYAAQDAYLTLELFRQFQQEMSEQEDEGKEAGRTGNDLRDAYEDIELPVLWVYTAAEEKGMRVDLDFVYQRISELTPALEHIKEEVKAMLGWELNPGSTDDVMKALIQEKLASEDDFINKRSGRTNLPEWVLEKIEHPLAEKVLAYRTAQKMLTSYFETIAHEAQEDDQGQWIVRCNFKQVGARTGRSSITEPALQTLPRKKGNVRGAFIAREEHQLIFADYSQQELRILAHYMLQVGDDSMAKIFFTREDLHTEAAKAIFQTDEPTKEQRDMAKNVNFAIVYGAGLAKIGSMLGIDRDEAQKLMNTRYYERFPGLRRLKKQTEQAMAKRGYVITLFGRRHRERDGKYAYKAINSLVQGSSADLTKKATAKIDAAFRKEGLASRVLLTVHDEIINESPNEEVDRAGTLMLGAMIDFPEIDVPLNAELVVANRWSEK
jgi:DNA polymerase I